MATLTPVQITSTGVAVTTLPNSAAGGGDVYDNTLSPYIEINNGSGVSITLYAAIYADGQTIVQGRAWTVGAGVRMRIAPRNSSYVNPANNQVSLTYSAVTTVTIGLYF